MLEYNPWVQKPTARGQLQWGKPRTHGHTHATKVKKSTMGRPAQHHIEAARARVRPQSRKILSVVAKIRCLLGSQIPGSQIGPVTCTVSDATSLSGI